MSNGLIIVMFVIWHLIGSLLTLMYYEKNGIMEYAAKHGDGIRQALPSDIIFICLVSWEIYLIVGLVTWICIVIDNHYSKKYKIKRG